MKKNKLAETEKYLMELLWERGEPTGLPVIMKLQAEERGWKHSTVHTMLVRMIDKGFVRKEKATYSAVYTKAEYRELETQDFFEEIHENSLPNLMSALSGKAGLTTEELDELQKWLDEQKGKKKK